MFSVTWPRRRSRCCSRCPGARGAAAWGARSNLPWRKGSCEAASAILRNAPSFPIKDTCKEVRVPTPHLGAQLQILGHLIRLISSRDGPAPVSQGPVSSGQHEFIARAHPHSRAKASGIFPLIPRQSKEHTGSQSVASRGISRNSGPGMTNHSWPAASTRHLVS